MAPSRTSGTQRTGNNRILDRDRAAHDWYRFVLSFPPHLVRQYLDEFRADRNRTVLDPFSGTGTTLVECHKEGIPSVGIEANRMAFFATSVKVDWQLNPDALLKHALEIAELAHRELDRQGVPDAPFFQHVDANTPTELRRLPETAEKLLLRNSISPLPLHKTLVLLEQIDRHPRKRYVRHWKLALAKGLVTSIGNLHFGPEVGVRKPKPDAPVVSSWVSIVESIAEDIRNLRTLRTASADVHFGDARDVLRFCRPQSIDIVLTSPPYPNEKDYTRTTRLESVLLGFLRNRADLREMKQGLIRSNTRNVYVGDEDDKWVSDNATIQDICRKIESRRIELGKTSGFERLYHRVTKLYFGGIKRHLRDLRPVLKPGACLAYVVGDQASYLRIMIRTGKILADLAKSLGYELIRTDLFRTRIATATKKRLREEVVLLRWPGHPT